MNDFRQRRTCVLIAVLVAIAVFAPSLANGLAYDDVPLLLGDPRIRPPYALREIFTLPYWYVGGSDHALYRPLTTVSFAVDWWLAGAAPEWAHGVNVLLHATATALLAALLLEFVPPLPALFGAIIFAVHPVHVEAVANVAGRAELLAAVCFLSACVLWVRVDSQRNSYSRVVGVAILGTAAVFSKENAIVLPAVLVLLDIAAGRLRGGWESSMPYLRTRGRGLAASLLGPVLYLAARGAVIGFGAPTVPHPAVEGVADAGQRILTALQAWPEYARLLFFPKTLLIDYGPQVVAPATSWTVPAAAGLGILTALIGLGATALLRGHRFAAAVLLWFPVTIFPVSNLVITIGVLVAERILYVPSVALSMGAAGVAAALLTAPTTVWLRLAWVTAFTVVIALSARTLLRTPEWESTERIFRAQVRDRPDSFRGHWYLGRLERERGNRDLAAEHYSEALRLWPYREGLVVEAAAFAVEQGRIGEARSLAAFAARQWPGSVEANRLLAATSLDLGDTATARSAVTAGLQIDPDDDLLNRMREVIFTRPPTSSGPDHGSE